MFIITPHLRQVEGLASPNQYIGLYLPNVGKKISFATQLSSGLGSLLHNLRHPLNPSYLKNLFAPLIFLPLLSPQILFLGSPLLLQHLLSSSFSMKLMIYHYAATVVPFLFIATVYSLKSLERFLRPKTIRTIIAFVAILCSLNIFSYRDYIKALTGNWADRMDPVRWEILQTFPSNATAITTFDFLLPLCNRNNIDAFFKLWENIEPFTGASPYQIPKIIQYAICDWSDEWLWSRKATHEDSAAQVKTTFNRISQEFSQNAFIPKLAIENIVLYERQSPKNVPLIEHRKTPFSFSRKPPDFTIDDQFELLQMDIGKIFLFSSPVLPLTFYWHAQKEGEDLYKIHITLLKDGKPCLSSEHFIGYGNFPTILWQKGDYVRETYNVLLSNLPSGEYTIAVYFSRPRSGKDVILKSSSSTEPLFAFTLGTLTVEQKEKR